MTSSDISYEEVEDRYLPRAPFFQRIETEHVGFYDVANCVDILSMGMDIRHTKPYESEKTSDFSALLYVIPACGKDPERVYFGKGGTFWVDGKRRFAFIDEHTEDVHMFDINNHSLEYLLSSLVPYVQKHKKIIEKQVVKSYAEYLFKRNSASTLGYTVYWHRLADGFFVGSIFDENKKLVCSDGFNDPTIEPDVFFVQMLLDYMRSSKAEDESCN